MVDEYQRREALIHFRRGRVLERACRQKEAVAEYRQALARCPHLREARIALGAHYQRHGLLAKAVDEFHFLAAIEGDFAVFFTLGCLLSELDRRDEARSAFQACILLNPNEPLVYYEIAKLACADGAYEPALYYLHESLARHGDCWNVRMLQARCLLHQGRYDEAETALQIALEQAPTPLARADVLDDLESLARHREQAAPRCLATRLYLDYGVAFLGHLASAAPHDARLFHLTYPDSAVILHRLIALMTYIDQDVTCVVDLDWLAYPVAAVLAKALGVPQRRIEDVGPHDCPLLVLAVMREPDILTLALEQVGCEAMTFSLGLACQWLGNALPDVVGMVAQDVIGVPWEAHMRRLRAEGAPQSRIVACLQQAATELGHAFEQVPTDTCIEQVATYLQTHQHLRLAETLQTARS